jgi:hypothetical protein
LVPRGCPTTSQPWGGGGQLDDVLEVVDRRVPSASVEVGGEWRPRDGEEHDVVAADRQSAPVASVHGEPSWCGRAQMRRQPRLEPYALAHHPRAGGAEQLERFFVAADSTPTSSRMRSAWASTRSIWSAENGS